MSKVAISAVLALLVGGVVATGAIVKGQIDKSASSSGQILGELSALRGEIDLLRTEVSNQSDQLGRMQSSQSLLATNLASSAGSTDTGGAAPVPAAGVPAQADLKTYILAALDEREQLQAEEREQQREEMRQQMEQRREEFAQLREGPYDRYNLKVNSLGNVLSLDDSQKQAYFELVKAYDEKWDAARDKMREEARAAAAAAGEEAPQEGRRGRGGFFGGDREAYRELSQSIQQEFAAAVPRILTATQLEVYNGLSDSAKSFQGQGYVSAAGEENPFSRMFGGGDGGFRGMRGGRGGR